MFTETVSGIVSLSAYASGVSISVLTSEVITNLGQNRTISLSFPNISTVFVTNKQTLGAFTSNVGGIFEGQAIPEPASVALPGIGITGLFVFGRFLRRTPAVRRKPMLVAHHGSGLDHGSPVRL